MSEKLRTHAARALVNRAALHLLSEDDALAFALAIEEQMARLAQRAPERSEPLNVERLARALQESGIHDDPWSGGAADAIAERVAFEYARLAEQGEQG